MNFNHQVASGSLFGIACGSLRARMLAVGLLAYLFYQYMMYALFWALGPLFPLFIALCGAAVTLGAGWLALRMFGSLREPGAM